MNIIIKNTLKVAALVAGAWAIKEYEIDKKIKSKWEEIRGIHSSKQQTESGDIDKESWSVKGE